ncbi:histidine kinase [Streptosporangium soli]|nr:histidine kinase [Streptosporangium sp. KLBMP 9127]
MAEQTHPSRRTHRAPGAILRGLRHDLTLVAVVVAILIWVFMSGMEAAWIWVVSAVAMLEMVRRRRLWPTHLPRPGELPVILVLAWAGWLAVPWTVGTPAQARATATEPVDHDVAAQPAHQREHRQLSPGTTPADAHARILGEIHNAAVVEEHTGDAPTAADQSRGVGAAHNAGDRSRGTGEAHGVAARAALEERSRIAGEVHDVAGHGLATIAMQAGVALLMFEERPEQARESLEAIRETSLQALNELRATLDAMHPMPSQELHRMIDGVRAGGLPVDLELGELSTTMPAHVHAAVYRVVRESLTNVIRHAGPTRALVRVAHEPCAAGVCGDLVVEIADRGADTAALPPDEVRERTGPPAIHEDQGHLGAQAAREDRSPAGIGAVREGRGLTGMRARVEAAGGTLSAGPREGGGFRVVARFPRAIV